MKFMEKIIKLIKEILLFMFIGIVIDGFYLIGVLSNYVEGKIIIISLLISGLIGIIIGYISKYVFIFVLRKTINMRLTIICEVILVMVLTSGVSYFSGGRDILNLLILPILGASFSGVIIYIFYSSFINMKLKDLQKKLKDI
ncbi:hypothetical protein HLVA_18810 [Haliovirga abyssi]|uniref:DUF3021 domain-containing protein n=2 Tax=Haliovirga abyssi TaxID=2996794 RepID=A0AAU9DMQ4_9FUSO|nr:hypothetical protein HLVA_18810 [Haliovirga abyssi]